MSRPALSSSSPPRDLAEAVHRIRHRGGRVTEAKRAVAELLYSSDELVTADEIGDRLAGLDRSVVYRCLAQFEALGIAEHVHLGHGQAVYRRRGLGTVPVTCVVCGVTAALEASDVEAFRKLVERRTAMTVDLVHFPLTGRCRDCADHDP